MKKIRTRVLGKFFPNKDSTVGVKSLICTTLCHACCFCFVHFLEESEFHRSGTRYFFRGGIWFEPVRLPEKNYGVCYSEEKSV